ncbi:glycosyltransferase family 2 protein, partial [bacterium]|nr:glycosyltransferase family 2 protein [bacterium]
PRKLRDIISAHAAERFVEKVSESSATRHQAVPTKVLVVSPCFNEEEVLPATIQALNTLKIEHPEIDYCIVNDGSRDSSLFLLKKHAAHNHTSHVSNAGVGAALLTGFLAARDLGAQYVVQCDSDGQHPFADIPRLVAYAKRNKTDLLIGSRFAVRTQLSEGETDTNTPRFSAPPLESTSLTRWFGGRIISLTLGLFGRNARIKDPTSGFRVYSRAALNYLIDHMPEEYPEPESIALLLQAGMKVEEVPVSMQARAGGVSSISGFKSAHFMVKVSTALIALRLRQSLRRT